MPRRASERLTDKLVRALPVPEKGATITYDADVPGFGARVTANDARSFVLNYLSAGRERRMTIGRFPTWSATAAREEARELPTGSHEIPVAIQDRSFNAGSGDNAPLFYPNSRRCFDDATDVPPIWNPEFFGNTIVVNGRTWPTLNVEPRRYRFRFLNGCNARFVILRIVSR